jgi:curved DNA-binding protein CbpA
MERIQDRHSENQALTHYEELGVAASASGDEIRDAYLNLVRLLHPDLQRAPSLKRFAENQMKRVGRAYAVLSDAERRRAYDAQLARGEAAENEPPAVVKRRAGRWRARAAITVGWMVCAFAGMVGIGWYVSRQASAPPPAEVSAAPVPPRPSAEPDRRPAADAAGKDPDSLGAELAAARAERDRALGENARQVKELDFLASQILAPQTPAATGGFSGVWILPKPANEAVGSAFTPEAVDLMLSEQQGTLRGRYRAHYPGMGVPEAPTVHFYFEGKCQGDVANASWTGDGGSKGQIQLRLVSANALELVWSVTEGSQGGPASGTVALVRKAGP